MTNKFRDNRGGAAHDNLPHHAINAFIEMTSSGKAKKLKEIIIELLSKYRGGLNSRQINKVTDIERSSVTARITEIKRDPSVALRFDLRPCPYTNVVSEFYYIKDEEDGIKKPQEQFPGPDNTSSNNIANISV